MFVAEGGTILLMCSAKDRYTIFSHRVTYIITHNDLLYSWYIIYIFQGCFHQKILRFEDLVL